MIKFARYMGEHECIIESIYTGFVFYLANN